MGSHSVICHPTQVNTTCLNPSQTGWYSNYLPDNTVIPYGKWRPVALRWGSQEELYRPLPFFYLTTTLQSNSVCVVVNSHQVIWTAHRRAEQSQQLPSRHTHTAITRSASAETQHRDQLLLLMLLMMSVMTMYTLRSSSAPASPTTDTDNDVIFSFFTSFHGRIA